jgi:hypothetical protein
MIHYGLPGTSLEACTAGYLSESSVHPTDAWMILPANYLTEMVIQDITARKIPFIPSRITTVSAFAKIVVAAAYPDVRILSPVEQMLIFSRIVENNPKEYRLFSRKTDPVSSSGKPVGLLSVKNFVALYNMLKFRNTIISKKNDRITALASIFTAYETFCDIEQIADAPTVLRLATSAVRSGAFPLRSVHLYGFFSPKKLEADLLDAVRVVATGLFEFAPYVANDKIFPLHEDIPSVDDDARDFSEVMFRKFPISPNLPIKKIGVFSDRISEFSAIAEKICCLIENGVRPGDIAVLTPEVPLYAELAEELFPDFSANGQPLEFTSSISYPLLRSRSIAAVFLFLKTILGNYTVPDMIALFSCPYFSWGERYISPHALIWISRSAEITGGRQQWLEHSKNLRARFSADINDPCLLSSEKSKLVAKIQKIDIILKKLEDVFSQFDLFGTENRSISDFISVLRLNLTELSYPQGQLGGNLPLEDVVAVETFSSILADIDASDTLMPPEQISLDRFHTMLSASVASVSPFPPVIRNSENKVKILGFHEIAHQKIPQVFFAGLTADVIPCGRPKFPFSTIIEMCETGTQICEEVLREERYAFLSALLAAKEAIYLSAPVNGEGSAKIPSVWLQMFDLPGTEWNCDEFRHSSSWTSERVGRLIAEGEWEEDIDCSHLSDFSDVVRRIGVETIERVGTPVATYDAVFSSHPLRKLFEIRYSTEACFAVTDLERYAACPFRWYTELHLRLTPHPDIKNDERTRLGNVIHKTMYRLVTESENFPPSKNTRDASISDLLMIANDEFSKTGSLATPKWLSLHNRYIGTPEYPGILSKVIDHEIVLVETGSTTPEELLEYPFSMVDMSGLSLPDGSELRLEGRIDRVRFLKGKYVVTDYKTGMAKKAMEIKSGRSLQLPLYLAAMEHLHPDWGRGEGTYYRIAADVVEEISPLSDDADCFIPDALLRASLCRTGMQAGRCQPVYGKFSCEYCRERFICRFDLLRSLSGDVF